MDLINQSRKYIVQQTTSLENSQALRLTYTRWVLIAGLFVQMHLNEFFSKTNFVTTNADIILALYAGFNLIIWLLTSTVAKNVRVLMPITLVLDLIIAVFISISGLLYATHSSPIFYFAVIPAFMMMLLIGLWEGVVGFGLVVGINAGFLFIQKYDFNTYQVPLWPQLLLFGVTLIASGVSIYILTQMDTPLLRVQSSILEAALARANEANLMELEGRAKAVYRVTNTLSATLDYERVIKSILEELETIFEMAVGCVLMFDDTLSAMKVVNSSHLTPNEQLNTIDITKGFAKDLLMRAQPLLIADNTQGDKLEELRHLFPSLQGCKSVMVIQLRAGFEVFGLVMIASKAEHAYGTSDLELMSTLTTHIVIAMQNATLYRNLLEDRNKILTREEELRHELARNLHDGPAQAVAAFSMQAEFIRRLFKSDPERALEELAVLGKQAQQTSKEIRTLLFGLRPLVLESQGLPAALEQYASRFPTQPNDPAVHFSSNFDARLDVKVESTVFTILQEAVNNARKHAQARNIWLTLEVKEGMLIASAQDDGKGFDITAVESNYDQRGSLGLTNMRERAQLVGGTSNLYSTPGKGTQVVVRVPINAKVTG